MCKAVQRHELWRDFKGLGPAWQTVSPDLLPEDQVLEVITRPRDCSPTNDSPGFVKWQQGFTPKEHREMLDRELALKHEAEVRQQIWDREDARDLAQEKAHDDQMKTLKEQHRRELLVFGGLIGLATIGSGILGGLASRGVDLWPL